MLNVEMTQQEKKELAGIYGFLVEVWQAKQSKTASSQRDIQQIAGKPNRK